MRFRTKDSVVVFIDTSSFITPDIDFYHTLDEQFPAKMSFLDQFTISRNKYPGCYGWVILIHGNSDNIISERQDRHNEKQTGLWRFIPSTSGNQRPTKNTCLAYEQSYFMSFAIL